MGEKGALQIMIDQGVSQPDLLLSAIETVYLCQRIETDEIVIYVIELVKLERRAFSLPHGKRIELPPIVQMEEGILSMRQFNVCFYVHREG